MGQVRALLTLMNSNGEITSRVFPHEGTNTFTQLARSRFAPFHREESQVANHRQLARFRKFRHPSRLPSQKLTALPSLATPDAQHLQLILEPFVEGVTVQSELPSAALESSDGRWVIPPSSSERESHHYVHLRPDDVIHFENHGIQIRYSLEESQAQLAAEDMPPQLSDPAEGVQVKSSDPQRVGEDDQEPTAPDSETEDEDERDLARDKTPVNATPAKSRTTTMSEINETRRHQADEEDAPFSTAQEPPENAGANGALPTNGASPSSEIQTTGDDLSPVGPVVNQRAHRASRIHESSSRIQSFEEDDFQKPLHFTKKTYSKSSRRNTPDGNAASSSAPNNQEEQNADAMKSDLPTIPTTSQTIHPKGPAFEAAERSLVRKRKLDQPTEDGEAEVASKVRKLSSGQKAAAATEEEGEELAEQSESDDDGPSQIEAGSRVSSGRLPRVARTDEDDEDTIVAKPKKKPAARPSRSSPDVVVPRAQRASKSASKTPAGTPSSTSTSTLTGKPPKIILSNVAGTYTPKSASTKFMKSQGSTIIAAVPTRHTNFVCVVKDDKLLKTPKVLRSLALGKKIVTERWVAESQKAGVLLDTDDFVHVEVADTQDLDRRKLFFGKIVYFTNAVSREYSAETWSELKELLTEAGASSVENGTGSKGGQLTGRNQILYIGTEDDPDATTLITDHDRVVYHKDLIKDAVVSGELDLEDGQYKLAAGKNKNTKRR